ncbi:chemotaxis protein CheB [Hymenobacter chitinivorans]|uniref:protein-glutamate methylesterase n=1 Tax=Hymenobacter chitinivorans DSM 11115 TaxID=1121954 RepID=A0A2M9BPV5_9BACT|nr:chemotaxis protein CheB [Hymenobacter chitinivorans]PJJ59980.1 two-component system chemotaxis response regulator CheB [Hymenobacter chitinivorans DSM 11115]
MLGDLPAFERLELTRLLHAEPDLRVVGSATSPSELVAQARRLRPGLVIASENQVAGLERLSRQQAVPVLLYSATAAGRVVPRELAQWGVADYLQPIPSKDHPEFARCRQQMVAKIRAVCQQPSRPTLAKRQLIAIPPSGVAVIGGSTGGAQAVETLVRALPASLTSAVLVAIHLPAHFTESFVNRLRRATSLPVVVGKPGTTLEAGKIIVAPGGQNMVVRSLVRGPWQSWHTDTTTETGPVLDEPSVDLLMQSVAHTIGRNTLGVVLTGLGRDGTQGAHTIRQHGGVIIAQDEASSAVFGMPKSVIQTGAANIVAPLHDIAGYIGRLATQLRINRASSFSSSTQFATR